MVDVLYLGAPLDFTEEEARVLLQLIPEHSVSKLLGYSFAGQTHEFLNMLEKRIRNEKAEVYSTLRRKLRIQTDTERVCMLLRVISFYGTDAKDKPHGLRLVGLIDSNLTPAEGGC